MKNLMQLNGHQLIYRWSFIISTLR